MFYKIGDVIMRKLIGVLLILIALSMSVAAVTAEENYSGNVNYVASGDLSNSGKIDLFYGDGAFSEHRINISISGMVFDISDNEFSMPITIPKAHSSMVFTQELRGIFDYAVYIEKYTGGDIDIKFIKGNSSQDNDELIVTYNGKTVVADKNDPWVVLSA